MKKFHSNLCIFPFRGVLIIVFISTLYILPVTAQNTKDKVVFPEMTIVPNDADLSDPVNFGLFQASPVGDINGDGMGDLVFNTWAADDWTPETNDRISKSLITFSPDINSSKLFYNKSIYGIGDFNGDNIDDFIDVQSSFIYFGNETGLPDDSLFVGFTSSNYPVKIIYANDINGDGYSDFITYSDGNDKSLYTVYVGPDATSIPFNPSKGSMFNSESETFHSYDYDSDGISELCVTNHFNNNIKIKWFRMDIEGGQMVQEHNEFISGLPDRTYFASSFADINGDGLTDICTAFYAYDSINERPSLNMEVSPGLSSEPYFDDPLVIEIWNNSRLLYFAGDFNGDGIEDLYSKTQRDSIVVYYGNEDVFTSGFQKVQYYTGSDAELLPKSRYLSSYDLRSYGIPRFYYNNDTVSDLFFNYWSYDENLRFNVIGTAIVTGGINPDFENPIIIGKSGAQAFYDKGYGSVTKNVGDINNDGYDDIGILANYGCYLDIYFGGQTIDSVPDIKFLLPQIGKTSSKDFTAGDINGDGWTDIIISNCSDIIVDNTFGVIPKRQNVYIFYGNPSMQNTNYYQDADIILNSPENSRSFAKSISVVGDYNADGIDDLVVGGNSFNSSLQMAFLYFGGNDINSEPDMKLTAIGNSYLTFAIPVTACGDVNADGYDDLMIGNPFYNSGRSLIYFGGPDADSVYDVVISPPLGSYNNFGLYTSHSKGDIDGDGFNDIVQYNYFKSEFYIYKGGPDFDNVTDMTYYDSTFMPQLSPIEFIDRSPETGTSDIMIGNRIDNKLYIKLYNGGLFAFQDILSFEGIVGPVCSAGASGDFNNDGLTEIIVGFPSEPSYGWPNGGIAKMYVPANYVVTNTESGMVNNNNQIKIYPNPVSEEMSIDILIDKPGKVDFKIIDLTGKTLVSFSRTFTCKGNNTITVNPELKTNGLYIMEINNSGTVQRGKFVFNKY